MNIILKNSLKNIFGRPFRTLLVVFSIFVCSLCAMISFDLVSAIRGLLINMFGAMTSGDLIATVNEFSVKGLPDGFPECTMMEINANSERFYKDIEGEYAYVSAVGMSIYGIDMNEASDMGFMDYVELGDREALITTKVSKDFGYKEGDTFVVHDRAGNEVELNVAGMLPEDTSNILLTGRVAVVNKDTGLVLSCGKDDTGVLFIDVKDDALVEDAGRMLEEYYPEGWVSRMSLEEEDEQTLDELTAFMYLLFAVAFLLVIFVTASICNRIVSERMSFIGTLRSLGMSTARTGRILLLENVIYAVLGSVPAVILYTALRDPAFAMIFNTTDSEGNIYPLKAPPVSVFLIAGVILGAVLVECLIPLKAILKALKTSIRDIIFDNRDTEYKYSKAGLFAGLFFVAGCIVFFFFRKTFYGATGCLVCGVVGLALVFPWVFKAITTFINNIAVKKGNAKWNLASAEARSRKSTVGSGVLCVTAAAMSIVVFAIAQSAMDSFSGYDYSSDVIVYCYDNLKSFSFIERIDGVTDAEPVFKDSIDISLNGGKKMVYTDFYAMPENGFKYYHYFGELPDSLEEGSIIVSRKYADKNGLKAGDTITITYDPEGVVPIEKEYKIKALVDVNSYDSQSADFILTQKEFNEIFREQVGLYLLKCDDPDKVCDMIETYAIGHYSDVTTMEQYIKETQSEAAQLYTIMGVIIAVAVGMTFIGMVSNQLIGFEGRKKECAIMLATSMGKGKLSGILFLEVLMTSFVASVMGTLSGIFFANVIGDAAGNSYILLEIKVDPLKCLLFGMLLIVVFAGTVLFPIKNLRKMKISEQLKYE